MGRPRKGAPPRSGVLLAHAANAFVRDGYAAAALDNIAREAGVSKATLYRHFRDKEALFKVVIRDRAAAVLEPLRLRPLRGQPRQVLTRLADSLLEALLAPQSMGLFRLMIAESARFPELGKAFFEEVTRPVFDAVASYLESQVKSGALRIEDPRLAAYQFTGSVKEALFWPRLVGAPPSFARKQAIRSAVSAFLRSHGRSRRAAAFARCPPRRSRPLRRRE